MTVLWATVDVEPIDLNQSAIESAVPPKMGRVVTITLRCYHYMPARNSNLSAWTTFARSLDPNRYLPVFIPDTDWRRRPEIEALVVGRCVNRHRRSGRRDLLLVEEGVDLLEAVKRFGGAIEHHRFHGPSFPSQRYCDSAPASSNTMPRGSPAACAQRS